MSNLKHLILLACFLVGGNFAFGQTLVVTDEAPTGTFNPTSTEQITITISNAAATPTCDGVWNVVITTSSSDAAFNDETINTTIDASSGTGSIMVNLNTPDIGDLIVNVAALRDGCNGLDNDLLLDVVDIAGTACDESATYLENFDNEGIGTGLNDTGDNNEPVGQGIAFTGTPAPTFTANGSYFNVRNAGGAGNRRLEARALGGREVFWESNGIPVSECCNREISIDVFGENGEVDDEVEVYYTIDGGASVEIQTFTGSFTSTVTLNTSDISIGNYTLRIGARIVNDGAATGSNPELHGIDNISVGAGSLIEAPQIQDIGCGNSGTDSGGQIVVNARTTSDTNPPLDLSYRLNDGAPQSGIGLFDEGIMFGEEYTITVFNTGFEDCGSSSVSVTLTEAGGEVSCDFLLPITLLDFYGRAEADAIGLYWTTSTELNNDYMAVERSLNGIDFEEIGKITGNGTTFEPQHYTFIDNHPVSGTNYYRLRQVDYDGAEQYHPVIAVLFDKPLEFDVHIFPNPARETLQIDWSLPDTQDGILRIFDMQGQLMEQRAMAQGSGRRNLPIQDLPAGMYVLQMEQSGQVKTLRFVKN